MKIRTIKTICAAALASSVFLAPFGSATAEEVRVPVTQQAERSQQAELPRNGLSEQSVRNGWGQPRSMSGPVGDPPISQWHYDTFTVYFEGNKVIHSVLRPNQ